MNHLYTQTNAGKGIKLELRPLAQQIIDQVYRTELFYLPIIPNHETFVYLIYCEQRRLYHLHYGNDPLGYLKQLMIADMRVYALTILIPTQSPTMIVEELSEQFNIDRKWFKMHHSNLRSLRLNFEVSL